MLCYTLILLFILTAAAAADVLVVEVMVKRKNRWRLKTRRRRVRVREEEEEELATEGEECRWWLWLWWWWLLWFLVAVRMKEEVKEGVCFRSAMTAVVGFYDQSVKIHWFLDSNILWFFPGRQKEMLSLHHRLFHCHKRVLTFSTYLFIIFTFWRDSADSEVVVVRIWNEKMLSAIRRKLSLSLFC